MCSFLPYSKVTESHIYTYVLSYYGPIIVYHKILNRVPCALQEDLVVNPSYFTSSHLLTPNSQYFAGNTPIPGNLTTVSYRHGPKITSGPLCFLSASVCAICSSLVETTPFRPVSEMPTPAEQSGHPEWPWGGSSIRNSILPSPEASVILNVHGASSTMIWISKQLRSCSLQKRPFSFP